MVHRLILLGGVLIAMAACQQHRSYEYSGTSYGPEPAYDTPGAAYDAERGCASGESADLLHQNRPGGSDYNPARCRTRGY